MHLELNMKNWSEKEKREKLTKFHFCPSPRACTEQLDNSSNETPRGFLTLVLLGLYQGQHIPISCWQLSFHPRGPSITFPVPLTGSFQAAHSSELPPHETLRRLQLLPRSVRNTPSTRLSLKSKQDSDIH